MHTRAAICFLIAIALYGVSTSLGAAAFGLVGMFFEIVAWVHWFAGEDKPKENGQSYWIDKVNSIIAPKSVKVQSPALL